MISIALTIAGDTPTGISLTALTRSDTSAAPSGVSLPIAFTNAGGGEWVAQFTDPDPQPSFYSYAWTATWSDSSTYSGLGTKPGATSGLGSLDAWLAGDLYEFFGQTMVNKWADLDGDKDATKIGNRIASAIAYGTAKYQQLLAGGVFAVPLQNASAADVLIVRRWAMFFAGADRLFVAKGEETKNRKFAASYSMQTEEIEREISAYRLGALQFSGAAVATTNKQVSTADLADAAGRPNYFGGFLRGGFREWI